MTTAQSIVLWSDEFSLDMPEIDAHHRLLIDLINKIWRATIDPRTRPAQVLPIVQALENYTSIHFSAEEAFMQEIGYERLNEHRQAHQSFIARIAQERVRVMQGERLSLEIIHYLKDWLLNHILVADKHYADSCKRRNGAAGLLGRFFKHLFG